MHWRKLINFIHPDRPTWTWMPTLKGPLKPLWPLYKRWAWFREEHDVELPRPYYRAYWWIQEHLDAFFVKEVMRRMKKADCRALYIHPREGDPAKYVIVTTESLEWHPSKHSHVEGRA